MKNTELARLVEHVGTLTAEFYIVNMTAKNVGSFSMTPEAAQRFHDMVNEFINKEENKYNVAVINTSIESMVNRLK